MALDSAMGVDQGIVSWTGFFGGGILFWFLGAQCGVNHTSQLKTCDIVTYKYINKYPAMSYEK